MKKETEDKNMTTTPLPYFLQRVAGLIFVISLGLLPWTSPALAISNSGFETGTLSDWLTAGTTSTETAAFGSGPTEGTYQAFLSTSGSLPSDATLEGFLGLLPGTLDATAGGNATSGSAIMQTFSANAGDVLSFDWNFLTNDGPEGGWDSKYNDTAFYTLNGQAFFLADTLGGLSPSATSFIAETGFGTLGLLLPSTGSYTLGFGVVDVFDTQIDSGLLVDNVSVEATIPNPEITTIILLGTGLAGLAGWKAWKRKTKEKAS